ncbi:MAG: hypothetical protein JWL68_2186 [Actinomycetia bacterium]|nr:hypothetical protein [Actinomycetes bacterium]
MYPLPEQPEPKTATLRPLPNLDAAGPIPLSAPLPDMLSAPLPAAPLTTDPLTTDPLTSGPRSAPLAGDMLPTVPGARRGAPGPAYPDTASGPASWAPDVDQQRARVRADMEGLRFRAQSAASWLESSRHYSRLINRAGVIPVSARMTPGDLAFLAEAREQILQFTELAGRLIDLHQPLDAGGITTDPSSPIRRCRSCMWRWPCPTFGILAEVVDRPPSA